MNSQCCWKAFQALGKSPLDQSIFEVLPAEEFPSTFFAFSLRLYSDSLLKLGGFLLGVNSIYSDIMLCTRQILRHVIQPLAFITHNAL